MTQFTFTLLATISTGMVSVLGLRLLPTLRPQLTGLALLAVTLPLIIVLVSGLVTFQMHADLEVLVLACAAAASILLCAWTLTGRIGRHVDELRVWAQAQERMFERFWRDDPARTSRQNSGLGLAIAKGLVEAHGGRIWAENRREGGARIAFSLPLTALALAHV